MFGQIRGNELIYFLRKCEILELIGVEKKC